MQSYFKYAVCWYYSRDTRASTLYSPSGREDPATGHIEKKVMTQGDCERIGGQLPEFYRAGNPQNKTGKLVIIFSQVSDPEFLNMQENIWAQHFQTAVPGSALWYNKSKEDALHTLATEYWAETWRRSHLAASLRDQAVAYGSALINGYSTERCALFTIQLGASSIVIVTRFEPGQPGQAVTMRVCYLGEVDLAHATNSATIASLRANTRTRGIGVWHNIALVLPY